jgi:hypothetical protein
MYEMRKLGRVSQEEDGCVVCDNIPIALRCPELDREATRVARAVMRTRLATNSRKSNSDWASLALLEDVCQAEIVQRVCCLVIAMGTGTLGMDDTLWDALE